MWRAAVSGAAVQQFESDAVSRKGCGLAITRPNHSYLIDDLLLAILTSFFPASVQWSRLAMASSSGAALELSE